MEKIRKDEIKGKIGKKKKRKQTNNDRKQDKQ